MKRFQHSVQFHLDLFSQLHLHHLCRNGGHIPDRDEEAEPGAARHGGSEQRPREFKLLHHYGQFTSLNLQTCEYKCFSTLLVVTSDLEINPPMLVS